jgi:hypothetical protein
MVMVAFHHTQKHTHSLTVGRNPLDEGSTHSRSLYLAKHNIQKADISDPGETRTRNSRKRVATDPLLRTRDHRKRQ